MPSFRELEHAKAFVHVSAPYDWPAFRSQQYEPESHQCRKHTAMGNMSHYLHSHSIALTGPFEGVGAAE
jgi:hypothetical protein